jgi:glutaminyl-tRNA synthetase
VPATVRLYDRLFSVQDPMDVAEGTDFTDSLNPESLEVLEECQLEPSPANAMAGSRYQFERQGYFCVDSVDSSAQNLVFSRTVSLRDSWAKIENAMKKRK